MDKNLEEALKIRYVKLYFTAAFLEDTQMPRHKSSAIRGGIGEMLLRANCIRERDCEKCDFEAECIVQRTLYSKFEKKPEFVTTGESVGYVLECEDERERFREGEQLEFQLLLFGKTIVYFNQFLQALSQLGVYGIGKEKAKFHIVSVKNTRKQPILMQDHIYMDRYRVEFVLDYVRERLRQVQPEYGNRWKLKFQTPLTLKHHNVFMERFEIVPVILAVKRRIYMLDCFEDKEGETYYRKQIEMPKDLEQRARRYQVARMSFRKNRKILLKGIVGWMTMEDAEEEALALLAAGELIHIGKHTSFGFGRYTLKKCGTVSHP